MKKLGIIGLGNMGSALLLGILNSSLKNELEISGYDIDEKKINSFKSTINISKSAEELIRNVETLLLAIKPQDVGNFLQNYSDLINTNNSILITIVAGLKIKIYRKYLSRVKIARVMPNTPSLVGYGASAIYFDGDFLEEEKKLIVNIFESCGIVEEVKQEDLLDVVTGLSGSGPAYVFSFINSLADGAVCEGLPRNIAIRLAIQTVLGAAFLAREKFEKEKLHLEELKDRVTSPGGTTSRGLLALEEGAFRSTVIKAVRKATERARELGEKQ